MRKPLVLSIKGVGLVFGLDWLPLVGTDPVRLVRDLVRRHGATHSVMSGAASAAVGLARLERGRARGGPLYSGAQVFGQLHPRGTVAAVLDLGVHGWCALAACEGAILARSDKVYAERALAEGALEDIRQAYPKIRVLSDAGDAGGALRLELLADATAEAVAERARLRRAPRAWWRRPPLWGMLALGFVLSGPRLAALYSQASDRALSASDIELAWSQAQAAAVRAHRLHGEAGTRALLGVFYALPVDLAGWRLAQASCSQQTARWVCKAEYLRVGAAADNQGLLRAARSDWQLDFPTMDRAWASWSSSLDSQALDQHALPSPADHDKYWVSALQAIQGALTRVRIERSQMLVVTAPLGVDRQPVPRPVHLRRYSTRSVQIAGPLRSANLLIPLAAHIAWSKAVLLIDKKSAQGRSLNPINLTLDGVLYEMDDPQVPRA